MTVTISYDHEVDGRWIAEIAQFPGVMAYGRTKAEAKRAVKALAREVLQESEQPIAQVAFAEV